MKRRFLRWMITATLVAVGVVGMSSFSDLVSGNFWSSPPAIAQRVRPQNAGQQVYQVLPDLPRENQYVSIQTGAVDPNNTLVDRIVRYHLYGKGRPANYRLDWKLTLADYLGANQQIDLSTYPGYDTLRPNPLDGDRAAVNRLTRAQREALVDTLVGLFSPAPVPPPATAPVTPTTPTTPAAPPSRFPSLPAPPKPGDAQLLMP